MIVHFGLLIFYYDIDILFFLPVELKNKKKSNGRIYERRKVSIHHITRTFIGLASTRYVLAAIYTNTYKYIYIYIYLYMYIYTYIIDSKDCVVFIYIHIHIHTYESKYIYIYIYIPGQQLLLHSLNSLQNLVHLSCQVGIYLRPYL
jgi:hypothetical protein